MSQQDASNWPAWISAIGAATGVVVVFLKSFFVTRAELREAIQDHAKLTEDKHKENIARFASQDLELKEIRQAMGRVEGQLSRPYPRLER